VIPTKSRRLCRRRALIIGPLCVACVFSVGLIATGVCLYQRSMRVVVDHSSPETVVDGFRRALSRRDRGGLVEAMAPATRAVWGELIEWSEELRKADPSYSAESEPLSFLKKCLCNNDRKLIFKPQRPVSTATQLRTNT